MRATPFAAFALLLAFVASGSALAHGYQSGALPEPSSISEAAPSRVVVLMSEPIEPAFSSVRVLDVEGRDRASGKAYAPDGNLSRIAVDIAPLANGTYTVAWEARWTSDGHDTKGTYGFAVGNVSIADILATQTTTEFEGPAPAEVALRTLSFVGAFFAAGAFLFCYFVDAGRSGPQGERVVLLAGIAGGAVLAVATAALWMHHAASVYDTSLMRAPMMALVGDAYIGKVFAGRLVFALAIVGASAFALRSEGPGPWTLAAGLAVMALPTFTLTSHAASESSHRALSVVADIVHLIGAAAWVGGLPLLAYALWRMRHDTNPEAGHIARRFSRLAMISSALVVVTGGIAGFLLVGPGNTLASAYGRVLVTKIALVILILLLGAWNQFVQIPRLEKRSDARTGLVRSATLETVLAVLVLVAAGALTGLAPGGPAVAAPTLATFDGDGVEMHAHLEIAPNRVGINEFNVTLTKLADGARLVDTKKVELFIEPPRSDDGESLGMSTVTLTPDGDGTYTGRATLGFHGTWTVTVFVQRPDAYDDAVVFTVEV